MKFNRQMSNGTFSIPSGVFKISGFEAEEKAESTLWTARWSF